MARSGLRPAAQPWVFSINRLSNRHLYSTRSSSHLSSDLASHSYYIIILPTHRATFICCPYPILCQGAFITTRPKTIRSLQTSAAGVLIAPRVPYSTTLHLNPSSLWIRRRNDINSIVYPDCGHFGCCGHFVSRHRQHNDQQASAFLCRPRVRRGLYEFMVRWLFWINETCESDRLIGSSSV